MLGIELGAGLYETLVIVPLWSASPPDSVVAYAQYNAAYPQFAPNQGGRFWIFVTPLVGLAALSVFFSGLKTRPEHRRWRLAAAIITIVVVGFTFAWFVPNIILLLSKEVANLSGERITGLAGWWVRLNWARAVLVAAAWLAALRALTISSRQEK